MEDSLDEKRIQISALTKLGHDTLSTGSPVEASDIFRNVCALADQTKDDYLIRACSFNLGACYVASGEAKIGLKHLEQAIPPGNAEDGMENYADLWYNIGVARHAMGNVDGALEAYEKAHKTYHELDTKRLESECLTKLAVCYHLLNRYREAYAMYEKSQRLYDELNDKNNQALCLVSATAVLTELGDIEECAKVLDLLLDVCQELDDRHLQAKIYHDIGLLYISEKLHESAAECFEQSLKCLGMEPVEDLALKATIIQNMGAACNYLKLYNRAIQFHTFAADLNGQLGDRRAQTQVFSNLAFAYTQKERYPDAITAFQHAIQAAKDSGDKESQCLATEGIAAIWFRLKDYDKAVANYKDALLLISCVDTDAVHADRIVEKLTDALQAQLCGDGKNPLRPKNSSQKLDAKRQRQPRLSKENRRSLIAKGLEELSSMEDSSEQDSSSDELDSQHTEKSRYSMTHNERVQSNSDLSMTRTKPGQMLHPTHNVAQSNGMNFSMKSTLSNSQFYEKAADSNANVPRADREYYLATVAQQEQAKKQEDKGNVKESSKMCVVM